MDVRVYRAENAPEGFDARFAATARRYVYRVSDTPRGRCRPGADSCSGTTAPSTSTCSTRPPG